MSEKKVNPETAQDKQDAAEVKNYTRTPNMLIFGYQNISPQEKWLYVGLKHLCGKRGTRHLSLRYISEQTGISVGALSSSKNKQGVINEGMIKHLHDAGLIHAEIKKHQGKGNPQYHITITDVWGLNQSFFDTRSDFGQDEEEHEKPVRSSDEPVQNSDKAVQISDEPVRNPVQYQDYIQDDNKTTKQKESITPAIATRDDFGATAPALSQVDLQEKSDEIPVTYADCLALLQEHNVTPKGDAVAIMVQARTLYALAHTDLEDEMSVPYARQENVDPQEKGQTDGSNSTYRSTDYAARCSDNSSSRDLRETPVEQKGQTDGHGRRDSVDPLLADGHSGNARSNSPHPSGKMDVAQQTPSSKPVQEVPPLAALSKMPEQAALMAAAEPKQRAKAAPKKAVEKPAGPPVAPPSEMEWGTRKCLQWFDFWRGAPLIGKFKLMQASTCAKGLAENYTEMQVIQARTEMEGDVYYIARGGCDICDVGNNIARVLKKVAMRKATTIRKQPEEELIEWQGQWMTEEEAGRHGYLGGWERYKGQIAEDGRHELDHWHDDAIARGLMPAR